MQRFFRGKVNWIYVFAIFFLRGRRGGSDSHLLLPTLLDFDLSLDQMEKLRLSPQEEGMTKDVFTGVLAGLMESVHVKLSDEAIDVPMTEEFG